MVSTYQWSVIELIAAAGLLLGAAGGAIRAVELAHESPSVRKTRAGAEDSLQRAWGAGLDRASRWRLRRSRRRWGAGLASRWCSRLRWGTRDFDRGRLRRYFPRGATQQTTLVERESAKAHSSRKHRCPGCGREELRNIRVLIRITIVSFLLVMPFTPRADAQTDISATIEQAIEVARQEAFRRHPTIRDLTFDADERNTRWQRYKTGIGAVSADIQSIEVKLSGQEYWAAYAVEKTSPGYLRGGGDMYVFIDTASGKVIAVLEGR